MRSNGNLRYQIKAHGSDDDAYDNDDDDNTLGPNHVAQFLSNILYLQALLSILQLLCVGWTGR
jgi:hypothetical protein